MPPVLPQHVPIAVFDYLKLKLIISCILPIIFIYTDSVGGGSMDYVYGELGVTCAFCFELRGKSEVVNFLLPPEQIEETGIETFVAVSKAVALCSRL